MEKITFKGLDPEDLHTCQHCKNAHYDINIHSMVCPKGIILAEFYIQVNDCKDWLSPYLAVAERLGTTEQALSKTLSRPTLTTTKLAAIIDAVNTLAPYRDPLTAADLQPLPDVLVVNGTRYRKEEK